MQLVHADNRIVFDNVTFRYGGEYVLQDVSMTIPAGSYVGIVGPNGGGKTTLLHLLVGLLQPSSGKITIFGHTIAAAKEHVEIGFVPQRVSQIDPAFPATVEEIVLSGRTRRLRFGRQFTDADKAATTKALAMTGLTDLRHRRIGSLSGGQAQRVFIARAIVAEPKILILDEPTVGVDAPSIDAFYELLRVLRRDLGLTIFMVSHDIDAVAREVTTIICLNQRLVCHVPSQQFDKEALERDLYRGRKKTIIHDHE
jgi:zinc transport system ATP-binding protein